jgi:hypothetical protein
MFLKPLSRSYIVIAITECFANEGDPIFYSIIEVRGLGLVLQCF